MIEGLPEEINQKLNMDDNTHEIYLECLNIILRKLGCYFSSLNILQSSVFYRLDIKNIFMLVGFVQALAQY